MTLEKRFVTFLGSIPGAELIDFLATPDDVRKADYFLKDRGVILELKTLTSDASPKIEAEIEKHRSREDFPVFYGEADLRKVLSRLSDGERIYRKIVGSITRSVEKAVRSAEEQASDTRRYFSVPQSASLLVVLNDSLKLFDPYLVGHRIAGLMRRERTGKSDAETLDFVWLLFESHTIPGPNGIPAFPSMLIANKASEERFPWFQAFHEQLSAQWADHNRALHVDGGSPNPMDLQFTSSEQSTKPPRTHLRRQELWEREYDAQPHLRCFSDSEVLAHGAKLIRMISPYQMKGGPKLDDAHRSLMREFVCFMREASFRALDWRKMPKT